MYVAYSRNCNAAIILKCMKKDKKLFQCSECSKEL